MEPSKNPLSHTLIIGGCGFLGHHISTQLLLLPSPPQISVLDLHPPRTRLHGITYHTGDITSRSNLLSLLQKIRPSIIIHTASPTFTGTEGHNRDLYRRVNIEGTRNLVECAGEVGGVQAFVYTSSASIVHDTVTDLVNADERWPVLRSPWQREYYSETKGVAEGIVLGANRRYGEKGDKMLTIALRPAGIFGEGDIQVVPGLLKAYHGRQTKYQIGANENLYDFTYVGNVAHAHILAAQALVATHNLTTSEPLDHERVDGEAFFITNGEPLYFWDMARIVWKAAGDETLPEQVWVIGKEVGLMIASVMEWACWVVGRKPNLSRKSINYSTMSRYYNIEKARALLGYRPLVGMEEGVVRTVRYIQEQRRKELGEKGVSEKDGEKR